MFVRHEVYLATKHGAEAKSYEGLGDAAKLKPLEVELKRLEDLSESIVNDFAHMRQREVGTTYFLNLALFTVGATKTSTPVLTGSHPFNV